MADLHENPLGTDGFEFVEFTSQNPAELEELFESMGFAAVAVHKTRNVTLYRQGQVNFLLNTEPQGQAAEFSKVHKAGANAMAFRVRDAKYAYEQALKVGAKPADGKGGSLDGEVLAIEGVGGSLLYLVDQYGDKGSIYDAFFTSTGNEASGNDCGLTYIDHLTHNLYRGNMDIWANYYEGIFNFREIRYFDIEGKLTGLKSRAMTSPCGKIRIPLNESSDDKSQIEEFLTRYNGEGIQHIALGTDDIFYTVEAMAANDIPFQDTPDTYYEKIDARLPGHGENVEKLKNHRVLVDGAPTEGQGLLLQIFTQDQIGPVFFEIIQRKGNEGFGEGNFQALFESIELDQIRRGVLDENAAEAG